MPRRSRKRSASCSRRRKTWRRSAGRRAAELLDRAHRAKRLAGVTRPAPMSRLLDNLLIFGRVLRRAGIDVHPRPPARRRRRARAREPRRTRRGLSRVPCAARPSPRTDCGLRPRLRRVLARPSTGERRDMHRQPASRGRLVGRGRGRPRARRRQRRPPRPTTQTTTRRRHERAEDLERPRRPGRQGLRRLHERRNWPRRRGLCLVWSGALVNAGHGDGFAGAARESIFDAPIADSVRTGGDVVKLAAPHAARAPPPAGAALRRQRIDGALLAHAAALRPRRDRSATNVSRRFFSPRSSRESRGNSGCRGPTTHSRRCRGRCRTGREGRGSAAPSGSSINGGAAGS